MQFLLLKPHFIKGFNKISKQCFAFKGKVIIFVFYPKKLEQGLKGEEVASKEIMAMSEEEIESEIKEVRMFCFF